MEVLNAQLERVACPAFLRPTSAAQLAALDFRRPLLIWLHAVFSEPRVRLVEDESWARADPSDEQLQRWLHSLVRSALLACSTGTFRVIHWFV